MLVKVSAEDFLEDGGEGSEKGKRPSVPVVKDASMVFRQGDYFLVFAEREGAGHCRDKGWNCHAACVLYANASEVVSHGGDVQRMIGDGVGVVQLLLEEVHL